MPDSLNPQNIIVDPIKAGQVAPDPRMFAVQALVINLANIDRSQQDYDQKIQLIFIPLFYCIFHSLLKIKFKS
jgi:hypothetical protein